MSIQIGVAQLTFDPNGPIHWIRMKNLEIQPYSKRYGFCYHEKSKIPFSYMLCLFCKKAYRGTKPEESFG